MTVTAILACAVCAPAPAVLDRLDFGAVMGQTAAKKAYSNAAYAQKMESMLRAKGIAEDAIVVSVLANAWHESEFDPKLVYHDTNGALSVGVLQLNDKGLGWGMSVRDRQDVGNSMRRLFSAGYFWSWVKGCRDGTYRSAHSMAYGFAAKVLRCARPHRAARAATAKAWVDSLSPPVLH